MNLKENMKPKKPDTFWQLFQMERWGFILEETGEPELEEGSDLRQKSEAWTETQAELTLNQKENE